MTIDGWINFLDGLEFKEHIDSQWDMNYLLGLGRGLQDAPITEEKREEFVEYVEERIAYLKRRIR